MKTRLLFAAALMLSSLNVRAQEAPPEFRQRMEELEKKAKEAKEAGRGDEAEKLIAEMRAMKQHLVERRKSAAKENLRAELAKAEESLHEAEKNGRGEAASAARHRIKELRGVMEQMEKDGREGAKPGEGEKDQPRGADGERRHHILQAAEHLHAAGMHDLADRLRREAGGGDQPRKDQPERRPEGGGELQELRQMVRKLNARLDELERKSGGDGPRK